MYKYGAPYSRRENVVRMLYQYGPLNRNILCKLSKPIASVRSINYCLHRLAKKKIINRSGKIRDCFTENFYQLSYSNYAKKEISTILNMPKSELVLPSFRGAEIEHSILCALWADKLKQLYPKAEVVRDFHINGLLGENYLIASDERTLYPDILLILNNKVCGSPVYIAIEIERNQKSKKRILHKLNKFSAQSKIDGVIYICSNKYIQKSVASAYYKKVMLTSRRTRMYGEYFLGFLKNENLELASSINVNFLNKASVSFKNWTSTLISCNWNERRNSHFNKHSNPGTLTFS